MKITYSILLLAGLSAASHSQAASLLAGQGIAEEVCSQCHGVRHPSADAPFPPLAGRDPQYLKTALKQYRDKTRVSDIMNAIAGSLSDSDISNVSSYYANVKN